MSNPSPDLSGHLSATIAKLRQLSQLSVQNNWHYYDADLAVDQATNPATWNNWPIAPLNAREHIAWEKGRRVRWLGQRLTIPAQLNGYPLAGMALRLALGWWAEAADIYVDGQLVQVGDLFDCTTRLLLRTAATPGDTIAIALRLVSPGHDDAALVKSLCLYEHRAGCPEPAFVADELNVLQLYADFAPETQEMLEAAIALLDWSSLSQDCSPAPHPFRASLQTLRQQLLPLSESIKQRRIRLLGHAHLDMAWLWAVEETWQAAERTFESVLSLQTDFPELIFCHSTPALYAWMEQHRPDLFRRIQQQVTAGSWEPIGGLWVEPELNLISGEAIARQILYGQRYYQEKLGRPSPIAWLPDTFGFNWQLPQLFKQGGIDYFVTQKLRWNDTTQFPYELFQWQAPDGTQILSLMSAPIGEGIDPVKMATFACNWEKQTGMTSALWLPGVGDHGGGPTRDMLELARRWQQSPFFPQLEFMTAESYLQELETAIASPRSSSALPVWNSDLYLEFHRGCYTTHAGQKRANRRSQELLYQAELWAALATMTTGAGYPGSELETAWKLVLFNQFHDILPGSAIPQVFVDANQAWEQVEAIGWDKLNLAQQAIAQQITPPVAPHPEAQLLVVFNSLNWRRSQVVTVSRFEPEGEAAEQDWQILDLAGQPLPSQQNLSQLALGVRLISFVASDVPGIGYRCFWLCPAPGQAGSEPPAPALADFLLENEFLRVRVDRQTGELLSVYDKLQDWEVLSGPSNQLQVFKDEGQYWDAWNIDPAYARHPGPPAKLLAIDWLEQGPLRSTVRVTHQINRSTFEQEYSLETGSALLKIKTQANWLERHLLLKAAFHFNLKADRVSYEIPCGVMQHPTQPQTAAEKARWEIPALQWADLSDEWRGVSLLNDCKHGYSYQPDQLHLTLLRGAEWPDPEADLGQHRFTYGLFPHQGNWQEAQTVRQGYDLNQPLRVVQRSSESEGKTSLPPDLQFFDLAAPSLILMAFKPGEEDSQTWTLRCYESQGETTKLNFSSSLNLKLEERADLLERSTLKVSEQIVTIRPWEIATFKVGMNPA